MSGSISNKIKLSPLGRSLKVFLIVSTKRKEAGRKEREGRKEGNGRGRRR